MPVYRYVCMCVCVSVCVCAWGWSHYAVKRMFIDCEKLWEIRYEATTKTKMALIKRA